MHIKELKDSRTNELQLETLVHITATKKSHLDHLLHSKADWEYLIELPFLSLVREQRKEIRTT